MSDLTVKKVNEYLNKPLEERLKISMQRAKRYAEHKGYQHLSDDFAQEVAIKRFKGTKQTIEQSFIDFLKREYGDTTNPTGAKRASERHGRRPPKDDSSRELQVDVADPRSLPGFRTDERAGAFDFVSRIPFRFKYKHLEDVFFCLCREMSGREIADVLGVSEFRICQLTKEVRKLVKETRDLEVLKDEYRLYKKKSQLFISWIEI